MLVAIIYIDGKIERVRQREEKRKREKEKETERHTEQADKGHSNRRNSAADNTSQVAILDHTRRPKK